MDVDWRKSDISHKHPTGRLLEKIEDVKIDYLHINELWNNSAISRITCNLSSAVERTAQAQVALPFRQNSHLTSFISEILHFQAKR